MGARLRATHGAESDKQDLNSIAFGRHVQVRDFSNSSPPPDPKPGFFFFKVNSVVRQPYREDQLLLTYSTYPSEICLRPFSFGFDRDIGNKSDNYYLSRRKQVPNGYHYILKARQVDLSDNRQRPTYFRATAHLLYPLEATQQCRPPLPSS